MGEGGREREGEAKTKRHRKKRGTKGCGEKEGEFMCCL